MPASGNVSSNLRTSWSSAHRQHAVGELFELSDAIRQRLHVPVGIELAGCKAHVASHRYQLDGPFAGSDVLDNLVDQVHRICVSMIVRSLIVGAR